MTGVAKQTRRLHHYAMSAKKRALWKSKPHECFYCVTPLVRKEATVDHLTPVSRGGSNTLNNFVLACRPCNFAKSSMTLAEFVDFVAANGGIEQVKITYGRHPCHYDAIRSIVEPA